MTDSTRRKAGPNSAPLAKAIGAVETVAPEDATVYAPLPPEFPNGLPDLQNLPFDPAEVVRQEIEGEH